MLDLRQKSLPECITVDKKNYKIKTDYRYWLNFEKELQSGIENIIPLILFEDKKDLLSIDWEQVVKQLVEFWQNPNSTPKSGYGSNVRIVDYLQDGEFIYASFLQAYNIDLLEIEYLHWWKFQALFRSLPEKTKIMEIMGYRAYKRDKSKPETRYKKARDMWALPTEKISKKDQEKLDKLFYNS